ncbi:MAG TPA: APC family permease [Terriglobales bacterium]|nr:APC family permease [Terriglobales bacterium]
MASPLFVLGHVNPCYNAAVNTSRESAGLVRSIGRWSLAALMVNSIIGSGIFGLPSIIARQLGPAAPLAWLLAAVFSGIIMGCFAEVASRFTEAGGPYLYSRVTFGRFVGILMGWLAWLVRIAAAAASANLFVVYLKEFWGVAGNFLPRLLILSLLIGLLAAINVRGVRAGTQLSNVVTVAKLTPLAVFIVVGGAYLITRHQHMVVGWVHTSTQSWLDAMLLMVFGYGGFEGALMPLGEAKDPRRDAPFALFTALITCTAVYTTIQIVVMGVLPNAALTDRPLATAARVFMGPAGAVLLTLGTLLSGYGYLASMMLNVPRLTYALAERDDFPTIFRAVHHRFRTPYISIMVFAALIWLLALWGNFEWNATLSAIARLFYFAVVCAALPVLRRREARIAGKADFGAAVFRLPLGIPLSFVGVVTCALLVGGIRRGSFAILLGVLAVAFMNWLWATRRQR